jgi:hypothetical protein
MCISGNISSFYLSFYFILIMRSLEGSLNVRKEGKIKYYVARTDSLQCECLHNELCYFNWVVQEWIEILCRSYDYCFSFLFFRCIDWQFDQAKKLFHKKYVNCWQISSSLHDRLLPFDGRISEAYCCKLCNLPLPHTPLCPPPPPPIWIFLGLSQYTQLIWVYKRVKSVGIANVTCHME